VAFGPKTTFPVKFNALIDNGSHTVLIHSDYANKLGLIRSCLKQPQKVELAMTQGGKRIEIELTKSVIISLFDPILSWSAKPVHVIVVDGLCSPVILGLPFLERNCIVIDHEL
jgi:hypothetical protein